LSEADAHSYVGGEPAPAASHAGRPAWAEMVRLHLSAVMAVCLARTRNLHDAEDLAQNVFLKAMEKLPTLRDARRQRAWLFQIARNTCTDHHRRNRNFDSLPHGLPARGNPADPRIERLLVMLSRLPEDDRETISLYHLDGRNCRQIAADLGISESAVRQRLVRARLKLHDLMMRDEP